MKKVVYVLPILAFLLFFAGCENLNIQTQNPTQNSWWNIQENIEEENIQLEEENNNLDDENSNLEEEDSKLEWEDVNLEVENTGLIVKNENLNEGDENINEENDNEENVTSQWKENNTEIIEDEIPETIIEIKLPDF